MIKEGSLSVEEAQKKTFKGRKECMKGAFHGLTVYSDAEEVYKSGELAQADGGFLG